MGKEKLNNDGQLTTLNEKQREKLEDMKKEEELNTIHVNQVEKVVKDPEIKERTQKQRDAWARCLEARKLKLTEKRLSKINDPQAKEQVKKSIHEHYENMKTQIIETKDEDLKNTYFIEPKQDRGPKPKPKGDKKEEKPAGIFGMEILEFSIVAILIIAIASIWHFSSYVGPAWKFINAKTNGLTSVVQSTLGVITDISLIVSAALLIGIIYSIVELTSIRRKEKKIMHNRVQAAYVDQSKAGDTQTLIRWRTILDLTESQNKNDWRQAIVDADSILDVLTSKAGFIGDSLGERMTNATKGEFKTLDLAWEAHKVRNAIAHEGSAFELSQYEAKRVIALYKKVFEEFKFI